MYRFGWTNASIVYGLGLLDMSARRALGVCAPYETYARARNVSDSFGKDI